MADAAKAHCTIALRNGLLLPVILLAAFSFQAIDVSGSANPVTSETTKTDTGWWRHAVLYEITPHAFCRGARFADLEASLPELVSLGVNAIWLQPLFATRDGNQGYDVIDYFRLRDDFGDEKELIHFIDAAHAKGMHVLLDFVANHTSIHHPFAEDRLQKGAASAYDRYYQSENDHAPYSDHYHINRNGFVTYFWDDLVNLNFEEPKVCEMIRDACLYWVRRLNIDGYRFDAAWALDARAPAFVRALTDTLHKSKPSLLLLAEDKGASEKPYDAGFDLAYDWVEDYHWVSHWSWEYAYSPNDDKTVFDHPEIARRKALLRQAIFDGQQDHPRLRFLENNDTRRFIAGHSLQTTRMAAALLFALPGVPLLYNGQEIGSRLHPYDTGAIFLRGKSIASLNAGLFAYYRQLIALRQSHPALTSMSMRELPATGDGVLALLRQAEGEKILVCVNLGTSPANTRIQLGEAVPPSHTMPAATDLLTNEPINLPSRGGILQFSLPAQGIRIVKLE